MVDRSERKVTSLKLTKYDFAAAYLDTSLLFLFTKIIATDESGCTLRLA